MVELDDPISLLANVGIVSYHEEGMTGAVKVMKNLHDRLFVCGVEIARGFVRQNDLGLVDKGSGNADALLFPA